MSRLIAYSALVMLLMVANSATALPPFPDLVAKALKDDAGSTKFLEQANKLSGLKKCDICHKPGADKKAKDHGLNDFGEAMHKSVNFKDLKAAMGKKDDAEVLKVFKEGLAKATAEKNADGKTFGDLIKSGEMPGKNG